MKVPVSPHLLQQLVVVVFSGGVGGDLLFCFVFTILMGQKQLIVLSFNSL